MSLPWIRLDTAIADHPKMLALIDGKKHKAALGYLLGLTYAGRHELDGYIPKAALPFIHATTADAKALCDVGLWIPRPGGWQINGWEDFQISSQESKDRKARAQANGSRMNCIRWHGADCGCWKESA